MSHFHWILGGVLASLWMIRLLQAALGIRRLPDVASAQWEPPVRASWPRVSIIVAARNEEQGIEAALRSQLALDYDNYEVIAVNDRSSDGTGAILEAVARTAGGRLKTISVTSLPAGWLGKPHAMWKGTQHATGEWLLFTDADVVFRGDALRRTIACAETLNADHFVLFPTMLMKTWGERMMVAAFQCMFVLSWGHSPWKAEDAKARDYVGVGAFNLIRRSTLEAIGGLERLRMEVLEDLKLGKLVKQHGFRQRIALGRDIVTIHWVAGALGTVRNLSKNFFALVNYHWTWALGASLALLVVNVGPFLGAMVAPGWSRIAYLPGVVCIAALYWGMGRYSPISPIYFLLHPLSSFLMAYSMMRSTVLTLWRGGVLWRGTKYPLEELRRGIV